MWCTQQGSYKTLVGEGIVLHMLGKRARTPVVHELRCWFVRGSFGSGGAETGRATPRTCFARAGSARRASSVAGQSVKGTNVPNRRDSAGHAMHNGGPARPGGTLRMTFKGAPRKLRTAMPWGDAHIGNDKQQ